jgi:hypothetical protein
VKVKCNVKYMCIFFRLCGMKVLSGLHGWGLGRVSGMCESRECTSMHGGHEPVVPGY